MLRRTDFNWLTVRLFGGWLAAVVVLLAGVKWSFRPTGGTAETVYGYAVLLFGFLLMGAWFRWCTRVSAEEAVVVCENCVYLEQMEEAVDSLDVEVQDRIRNYRRTADTELAKLEALASSLHQEVTGDVGSLSGHGLLTHDNAAHPDTEQLAPVTSEKDTGRHRRTL